MRVLHLVHQYPPEFVGGVELYTQTLGRELVGRGWTAGIFYRSFRASRTLTVADDAGATTFAATDGPLSPNKRFLATWREPALAAFWLRVLDDFSPDLVHVQHLMGLPASLLTTLADRRIPYLVSLHDYWWICANANLLTNYDQTPCGGPQAFVNCAHCAVARAGSAVAWGGAPVLWGLTADRNRRLHPLLEQARAILAPSEFVHRWYADHGAPAGKLRTLPLGVMKPKERYVRSTRDEETLHLLYAGGLAPIKGVHIVLEALQGVKGSVHLAIAGDERSHPEYTARLRHLADGRVTFLGRLNRAQLWQMLADADAVVVPSLWHETFSFIAHEALTAGTPVLASAMGALTNVIHDGRNGQLLAAGDVAAWRLAIQEIVQDRSRLDSLRANIVEPLTFAEHIARIEGVYQELLAGKP